MYCSSQFKGQLWCGLQILWNPPDLPLFCSWISYLSGVQGSCNPCRYDKLLVCCTYSYAVTTHSPLGLMLCGPFCQCSCIYMHFYSNHEFYNRLPRPPCHWLLYLTKGADPWIVHFKKGVSYHHHPPPPPPPPPIWSCPWTSISHSHNTKKKEHPTAA